MVFLLLVIIIIIFIINFFRRVFSENTEANVTSLLPLDTIVPEICAFIIVLARCSFAKYTLFISTRTSLLQSYLSAYNNDVTSNTVATLKSVQSMIANICVVLLENNKNQHLQIPLIILCSPFTVLHSMLVSD